MSLYWRPEVQALDESRERITEGEVRGSGQEVGNWCQEKGGGVEPSISCWGNREESRKRE